MVCWRTRYSGPTASQLDFWEGQDQLRESLGICGDPLEVGVETVNEVYENVHFARALPCCCLRRRKASLSKDWIPAKDQYIFGPTHHVLGNLLRRGTATKREAVNNGYSPIHSSACATQQAFPAAAGSAGPGVVKWHTTCSAYSTVHRPFPGRRVGCAGAVYLKSSPGLPDLPELWLRLPTPPVTVLANDGEDWPLVCIV